MSSSSAAAAAESGGASRPSEVIRDRVKLEMPEGVTWISHAAFVNSADDSRLVTVSGCVENRTWKEKKRAFIAWNDSRSGKLLKSLRLEIPKFMSFADGNSQVSRDGRYLFFPFDDTFYRVDLEVLYAYRDAPLLELSELVQNGVAHHCFSLGGRDIGMLKVNYNGTRCVLTSVIRVPPYPAVERSLGFWDDIKGLRLQSSDPVAVSISPSGEFLLVNDDAIMRLLRYDDRQELYSTNCIHPGAWVDLVTDRAYGMEIFYRKEAFVWNISSILRGKNTALTPESVTIFNDKQREILQFIEAHDWFTYFYSSDQLSEGKTHHQIRVYDSGKIYNLFDRIPELESLALPVSPRALFARYLRSSIEIVRFACLAHLKFIAFALATHERLGRSSGVGHLNGDVLKRVKLFTLGW